MRGLNLQGGGTSVLCDEEFTVGVAVVLCVVECDEDTRCVHFCRGGEGVVVVLTIIGNGGGADILRDEGITIVKRHAGDDGLITTGGLEVQLVGAGL